MTSIKYKGDINACLQHYFQLYPGRTGGDPLATFVGTTYASTVKEWFKGKLPKGEYMIRLQCFLSFIGYELLENQDLSPEIHELKEVIGFQVANADSIRQRLGYQNIQDLFRVLTRNTGMIPKRYQTLMELLDSARAPLKQSKIEASVYKRRLGLLPPEPGATDLVPVAEGLRQYIQTYPGRQAEEFLAQFVGIVINPTLKNWLRGANQPRALQQLKLRNFLVSIGYRLMEVEYLYEEAVQLGKMIAFDVISFDQAQSFLDFRASDDLMRVLLDGVIVNEDRMLFIKELMSEYGPALENRILDWQARRQEILPEASVQLPPQSNAPKSIAPAAQVAFPSIRVKTESVDPTITPVPMKSALPEKERSNSEALNPDLTNNAKVIDLLAALLSSAKPLAELLDSNNFTEADRTRLRAQVGDMEFFNLSNTLFRLSGKRARQLYPKEV